MGLEAVCSARFLGHASAGKALLETDALYFRGETRLKIPLKSITGVTSENGELSVSYPDGTAVFELGSKAEKWAQTILHPHGRMDKLGIRPGMRIALVGVNDEDFRAELAARDVELVNDGADLDAVFLGASSRDDLQWLRLLSQRIKPAGAIWVISPRGGSALSERDVMESARSADLVDVKVVRFSDTHTSAKLVIPVALRKAARR